MLSGALMAGGALLLALGAVCWTDWPARTYGWLSMTDVALDGDPQWIVVLGGRGIPSETGLIRTYYGAEAARRHPEARIIVALPGDASDPGDAPQLMRSELVLRGVAAERILVEPRGVNTRQQAVEILRLPDGPDAAAPILVVTSPDHVRRAVMVFSRLGFERVGGCSAIDANVRADLSMRATTADPTPVTDVIMMAAESPRVRYGFWNQSLYLVRSARELTALAYYKLRGWI